MRTFVTAAMAIGLAACLGTTAQAQGGRGGFGGGGLALLSNKSVQKELKLTDEQIEKADKAATEMREKNTEKFTEIRSLEGDERTQKMAELQKEIASETKKVAGTILKPEQAKRFEEISLQIRGAQAFSDSEVQGKLKLTDDQKSKLKSMSDEMQARRREVFAEFQNDREAATKKMTEMQKEGNDKAMALLTDDQKSTWKGLIGSPFDYKPEAPRPRQ